MSPHEQIRQTHSRNIQYINSGRFFEAFNSLKKAAEKFPVLKSELEKTANIENTYRYMLKYLAGGNIDPASEHIMNNIRENLSRLNDLLIRQSLLIDSSDLYSSTKRMELLKNTTFSSRLEEIISGQEQSHKNLFNFIFTMFGSPKDEYEALSEALLNPEIPQHLKRLMISAIILGNTSYFDADSLNILLDVYEIESDSKIRALTIMGIVLIALVHSKRLVSHENLKARFLLMKDDEELKKLVQKILFSIVQTYDTKRVDSKMREEVIPGLMKIQPDIINKMRNMASESEDFLSNENPEWEEILEESGISDKIQEINDMQLEGSDVLVTAFSSLKNFPFFNEVANWFEPFMPDHPELAGLPFVNNRDFTDTLSLTMCDSDIYSFMFSLRGMPEQQAKMMWSNMKQQMTQAKEALSPAIGETEETTLMRHIKHSLQDLYRFFKFYRRKSDFNDPFALPFVSDRISPLKSLLDIDNDTVKLLGEFYFKHGYFEEAADMLIFHDLLQPGEPGTWEKIGYSFDRLKRYDDAVGWYKKAEILSPDNGWLQKKLAISLKNSGKPAEAKEYYLKALEKEPENFHLLMSFGRSLLDLEQPKEALQQFYHAEYLKPDRKDVARALAWSELMAGNAEKADKLYSQLTSSKDAHPTDYLNAAHCAMSSGDFKKALQLYSKFVELSENKDITALLLALKEDASILKKLKISTSDLRLIVDIIRYGLTDTNSAF